MLCFQIILVANSDKRNAQYILCIVSFKTIDKNYLHNYAKNVSENQYQTGKNWIMQ